MCRYRVTHLKLLDRVFSSASFFTGCVIECDIAHIRSVALLCMLYKISVTRCTLYSVLYVPVRVTLGALVAHRYTYAPPRYRTSRYRNTFISLSVSLWNGLAGSVFDGVGMSGVNSKASAFLLSKSAHSHFVFYCFPSSSFFYWLVLWGCGLRTDRVQIALSQPCIANPF